MARGVLITGSAGQLGSSMAKLLGDRSCPLAFNDVDEAAVRELAASVAGAVPFPADVSDPAAAVRLIEAATDRLGAIDVLINAAGIEGPIAEVENLDPSEVRRVFDVNVMSMFWLCRAAVPVMKRQGRGRIVNLASGAGLAGGALASPYHASKHAVVGLTRSLARELGPHRIAVNAVCPGYVDSPMVKRILDATETATGQRPEVIDQVPMGRLADPDEVAAMVAFLALDAPEYLTGTSLVLDGALRA